VTAGVVAAKWQPRQVAGPGLVAALVLLLSFHQVVAGAVRHAHERQGAATQQVDALAGCRGLATEASRALCKSRLGLQVADAEAAPVQQH
jgi:hypothetical protein